MTAVSCHPTKRRELPGGSSSLQYPDRLGLPLQFFDFSGLSAVPWAGAYTDPMPDIVFVRKYYMRRSPRSQKVL